MPDSNDSVNIVIRTQADLAGAQAAQVQLERDIAKAKELGQTYHVTEIQLRTLREAIEQHQQTNSPPLEFGNGEIRPITDNPPADTGGLPGMLLGIIQSAIRTTRQALESNGLLPEAKKPTDPPAPEPPTNSTNPPPTRENTNSTNGSPIDATNQSPWHPYRPSKDWVIPSHNYRDDLVPPQNRNSSNRVPNDNSSSLGDGQEITNALASQSQSVQSSGERLRAAVEQNTFLINSLFLRTLDLIDAQNRKLTDVDRKISELSNQIKSLKNP